MGNCGNVYNIGMGCCQPVLGPIENYYTKWQTDDKIEEAISGISAVTIDEVQEMIDESISGISGVTEEEMNNAIASAKTEIEAEIPSLDGYATEQWVEDKHYITGVDLSDYSTTEQMNNAITAATDGLATTAYVNQRLSGKVDNIISTGEVVDVLLTGSSSLANWPLIVGYDYVLIPDNIYNVYGFNPAGTEGVYDFGGVYNGYLRINANYTTSGHQEEYESIDGKFRLPVADIDTTKVNRIYTSPDGVTVTLVKEGNDINATEEIKKISGKQDQLVAGENITISGNVISAQGGGSFDPTQYYNKTATDALLANKLNISDFNSYSADTQTYINNKVSEVSGSTDTLSGDVISLSGEVQSKADTTAVTQVNNDLTAHTADTGIHVTSAEKNTWNGKQDILTAGTGVNISENVISMKIWSGTKAQFDAITVKDNETIYLVTD